MRIRVGSCPLARLCLWRPRQVWFSYVSFVVYRPPSSTARPLECFGAWPRLLSASGAADSSLSLVVSARASMVVLPEFVCVGCCYTLVGVLVQCLLYVGQ